MPRVATEQETALARTWLKLLCMRNNIKKRPRLLFGECVDGAYGEADLEQYCIKVDIDACNNPFEVMDTVSHELGHLKSGQVNHRTQWRRKARKYHAKTTP